MLAQEGRPAPNRGRRAVEAEARTGQLEGPDLGMLHGGEEAALGEVIIPLEDIPAVLGDAGRNTLGL